MENNKNINNQQDNEFKIIDFLFDCLSHWYAFVISVVVVLALATLYIASTHPSYSASSCLVIKQDRRGGTSGLDISTANFSNMGTLFAQQTNVNNEILAFQSPDFMRDVVRKLDLRANYSTKCRLYQKVLYGGELPLKVNMVDFPESRSLSMTIRYVDNENVQLEKMTTNVAGERVVYKEPLMVVLNDTIDTPVGRLQIVPNILFYDKKEPFSEISFSYIPLESAARSYLGRLSVSLTSKEATAVTLAFTDRSAERATAVLKTLIEVYDERWVGDRNRVVLSTSKFINERLAVIERELGDVDSHISQFKSSTGLLDPQAMGNMYLSQSNAIEKDILNLNMRLNMAQYIREYMASSTSDNQLLPANSGLENSNIESQISEYNAKQLRRNNLVSNSSMNSPIIVDLDNALEAMRASIMASIDNYIVTLKTQIASIESTAQKTAKKITMNPMQVEHLTDVQRQQAVKEALYLFLLQKREENEIGQAFTAYNTRVLSTPTSSGGPVAPNKNRIMLLALFIGLALPAGVLYLLQMMNNKVAGRKDMEWLSAPFIGEIPLSYKRRSFNLFVKSQDKNAIVVKANSRDICNEAFRVLRANLEMIENSEKCPVIQTMSLNAGSGKTFIAMNLATALAIKGKKVCVVDLDIRKCNLSTYVGSPHKGVTQYLIGKVEDYRDVIVKSPSSDNMDVIPVGAIPPNPTELLYSERLKTMIEQLKTEYDYVFIDSTPVNIVADAAIVNKYVDRSIFVVRAGLFEKDLLNELENYYLNSTYKGVMVLLNGTELFDSYSYKRRYGYHKRSGYGYGYGYGSDKAYGYGDTQDNSKK